MEFIFITPEDLNLTPMPAGGDTPSGMDWDFFKSMPGDENLEARLFESVLGCLADNFTVDSTRIYAMGHSGGAIVANMLHARYPQYVAAVFASSGVWHCVEQTVEKTTCASCTKQTSQY